MGTGGACVCSMITYIACRMHTTWLHDIACCSLHYYILVRAAIHHYTME